MRIDLPGWLFPPFIVAALIEVGAVDVDARLVETSSGRVVAQERLTPMEDCEFDAEEATVAWIGSAARFVSRHDEVVVLHAPDDP